MKQAKRRPDSQPAPAWGYGRLAADAVIGLSNAVEAMHHTISRAPLPFGPSPSGTTRGLTGFVYEQIRTVAHAVGMATDLAREMLEGLLPETDGSSPAHESVVAVLNGIVGDYLADTGNPLAIRMEFRQHGHSMPLDPEGLRAALESSGTPPTGNIAVMVGGLCMNDLMWNYKGHDHGKALAADVGCTPVYLRYNSGRHISTNGCELAELLEQLLEHWPVPIESVTIVAHSMGGLVARSAFHYAGLAGRKWPKRIDKVIYLGTPHHGAPLERGGNWLQWAAGMSPYTAPLARLGMLRSAAITDLRHGYLLDDDWNGVDRFDQVEPPAAILALCDGPRHYAIAASLGSEKGTLTDRLLGDGMVPLESALGMHEAPGLCLTFPPDRQWVGYGTGHIDLVCRPEVYATLRRFFTEA